jgi:hypothetical protein
MGNTAIGLLLLQLKRKTAELTRACEKHYELEQELAFYKIDHKFEELSKPPKPLSTDEEVGTSISLSLSIFNQ